jgi:hypothetical protein
MPIDIVGSRPLGSQPCTHLKESHIHFRRSLRTTTVSGAADLAFCLSMHDSTLNRRPRLGYTRIGMILAEFSWKSFYPRSPHVAAKLYAYWINYHEEYGYHARRERAPS